MLIFQSNLFKIANPNLHFYFANLRNSDQKIWFSIFLIRSFSASPSSFLRIFTRLLNKREAIIQIYFERTNLCYFS